MSLTTNHNSNVTHYEDTFPVRRHEDIHRYRATVPRKMFENAGLEESKEVSVSLDFDDEGHVVFVYSTDTSRSDLTIMANKHNTSGELTIPSALASALKIDGTSITWSRVQNDDGSFDFRAQTEVYVQSLELSQDDTLQTKELYHAKQDVTHDGNEWEQEHFHLYLNNTQATKIGWEAGEMVGIEIVRAGKVPFVRLTTDLENINEKSQKKLNRTNYGDNHGMDIIMYVPNAIVKGLNMQGRKLSWINYGDGELLLYPAE